MQRAPAVAGPQGFNWDLHPAAKFLTIAKRLAPIEQTKMAYGSAPLAAPNNASSSRKVLAVGLLVSASALLAVLGSNSGVPLWRAQKDSLPVTDRTSKVHAPPRWQQQRSLPLWGTLRAAAPPCMLQLTAEFEPHLNLICACADPRGLQHSDRRICSMVRQSRRLKG